MKLPTLLRRGLLALGLVLLVAPGSALAAGDGWLRTDGTIIRDASGQQFLPTGAQSVSGVTDATVAAIRQAGFNTMRFTVPWARIEGAKPSLAAGGGLNHSWSQGWLNGMDAQIRRLTANGIRVILEMHQSQWSSAFRGRRNVAIGLPAWLYPNPPQNDVAQGQAEIRFYKNVNWPGFSLGSWRPQELSIEVTKFLAQRYKDNSYVVGFDLINEPGWPTKDTTGLGLPTARDLLSYYHNAANALHAINPRLLIVYESGTFAQAAYRGGTILNESTGGLTEPNAVMSWHYYPAAPMSDKQFQLLVGQRNLAGRFNQPLWIGEFDAYAQAYDKPQQRVFGAAWKPLLLDLMRYTKANDIGWSLWAFQRGAGSNLLARNGALKMDIISVLRTGE